MKFFEWLDSIRCLRMEIWDFSFRSLVREYGRDFVRNVMIRHPIRTIRGIRQYRQWKLYETVADDRRILLDNSEKMEEERKSVTGAGFCLKPMNPACVSGRGNHNCYFFEKSLYRSPEKIPDCCRQCAIREIGILSLSANRCFYIMTSARDILYDLVLPALEKKEFTQGLFVICRYSFDPFRIALMIAGIAGQLFPYEKNDCRDYPTWLLADIGIKKEQTEINPNEFKTIQNLLNQPDAKDPAGLTIQKKGNLFYPHD